MSTPRPTPKVGDTLYSLNVGNNARSTPQVLTPVKVLKVGRLYFTCAAAGYVDRPHMHMEYRLSDWRQKTNYSITSALYATKEERSDELEAEAIRGEIKHLFGGNVWNNNPCPYDVPPLSALHEIRAILQRYPSTSRPS